MTNGFQLFENEEYLESNFDPVIKQEPLSEDESLADLSKDCILCSKQFQTLSGLRAHVLTHHNYKTVKRKFDGSISPAKTNDSSAGKSVLKYTCQICKRNFTTSTDLKVHEVCHDKFTCFACDSKFETFRAVTQHRRWCKVKNTAVKPPKTLTDILKERKAQKEAAATLFEKDHQHWECLECMQSFINIYAYKLHNEQHHPNLPDTQTESNEHAKEMIEIEINIKREIQDEKAVNLKVKREIQDEKAVNLNVKREIQDEKAVNLKKEKEDAEFKKIETELESMFKNPGDCENSCTNVLIDKKSEKLDVSNFRNSDQDTIENILCSVANKDNDKNGHAFKHDSENQNVPGNAFKDSINFTKTSKESNVEANSENTNKEQTQENESVPKENDIQNVSIMDTNNQDVFRELTQISDNVNKEQTQENESVPKENDIQNVSIMDTNNQDVFRKLTQISDNVNKENDSENDTTMETNDEDVLRELIQENDRVPKEKDSQNDSNTEINSEVILNELTKNNDSVRNENDSQNNEVTLPSDIGIIIDTNMETKNEDVLKESTEENNSDFKESDSQSCKEVAPPSEDKTMEVDASDNNNVNQNTESNNPELAAENIEDSQVCEKTDLAE